jgi:ABC-type nitrate/sulfonate/bicarbonate transport system substrate-binding protein
MATQTTIRVALDWTPNTIHSGLYLSLAKGLYSKAGLDVQLISPDASYTQTPAKLLESRSADLAICPSESCIAYAESRAPKMHLQAIYAILQRDASAIVSTKLSRIRELGEGKVYGSYNARYEDRIVRAMVSKDGGNADGVRVESSTGKHSLFDAVKAGSIDATWVFMPWEGVEADGEGVAIHAFRMEEYGIPYGYSPVIARNAASDAISDEIFGDFVKATREGYELAVRDPEAAVDALKGHCVPQREKGFLGKSQASINQFYGDGGGELGRMSEEKWETWVQWLREQKLLQTASLDVQQLYTNKYFT